MKGVAGEHSAAGDGWVFVCRGCAETFSCCVPYSYVISFGISCDCFVIADNFPTFASRFGGSMGELIRWRKGIEKREEKRKLVIYSDFRESSKNFKIKFGEYEKFPTFATRYGGND
ncbi:MAG: hypothetical protein ACQUHE_15470 [Bacteroidia bacterium]